MAGWMPARDRAAGKARESSLASAPCALVGNEWQHLNKKGILSNPERCFFHLVTRLMDERECWHDTEAPVMVSPSSLINTQGVHVCSSCSGNQLIEGYQSTWECKTFTQWWQFCGTPQTAVLCHIIFLLR